MTFEMGEQARRRSSELPEMLTDGRETMTHGKGDPGSLATKNAGVEKVGVETPSSAIQRKISLDRLYNGLIITGL